jgi:UDP-glucose 4-epimerase
VYPLVQPSSAGHSKKDDKALRLGLGIGIGVGGFLLIAAVAVTVAIVMRQRAKRRAADKAAITSSNVSAVTSMHWVLVSCLCRVGGLGALAHS